ncbi:sigma-70 family RNA polymerase sigma factor [Paenibacillus sp. LHD-117]|uniref:RNA polymerase sigma factor n=1 Tax=Paenibacillus sp. LHD-117 TaxID=3071412 RepID=UPI0027E019D0|nr:sigma-70 family RNA polymerase sigma factor [Paenibacillus sp. LHD-117]MDQ6420004.1 sigma-70 family RNA polymerase sigma factor [Paenibacillus sp. LHD-117]
MSEHYLRYLAPGYDRAEVLEDLMREYGEDVWRFAYFLTRRRDAADDIAQETFIVAYRRLYAFRGESSVKSWLLGIARNKSLHYLRSAFFRKVVLTDAVAIKKDAAGAAESAEDIVFGQIAASGVWETVMTLQRKHREVVLMAYHYEMTMTEIASALGVSEGTVKSRLSRAKRKMSELLDESRAKGG